MARRRGGFQKKIQYTHWTYGSASVPSTGAGSSGVNVLAAQHEPETLLRIRGEYAVSVDAPQAPGNIGAFGVGLILVPEGTGTTVLWSPITDGDAPWIWVDYAAIGYEEMVIDVIDVPGLSFVRRVVDNKAMRIIRNQEVQLVQETVSVIGTVPNLNLIANFRILSGK